MKHHRRAVYDALRAGYFGLLPEEAREAIGDLPSELQQMILINANGWVLAQGQLTLDDGRRVRALELILGRGGPRLKRDQRSYLGTLAAVPFTLYEVQESRANYGILLKHLMEEWWRPAWIGERSGSGSLADWDVIGTRLIFTGERYHLCGGIYPFKSQEAVRIKKAVFDLLGDPKLVGAKWHSRPANDLVADFVIATWLSLLWKTVGPDHEALS